MPDLTPEILVYGFISYIVFLFSTTCHEAAHALVAKLGGDSTAALSGQMTLNPVPHIRREPWGMVVIPILAFLFTRGMIGWASAPFDPLWERDLDNYLFPTARERPERVVDETDVVVGRLRWACRWGAGGARGARLARSGTESC